MIRRWLPLTLALALYAATPASAATYDVATTFGPAVDSVAGKAGPKVRLPASIDLDFAGQVYGTGSGAKRSYDFSIAGDPNCGGANACFLAEFSAKSGGKAYGTKKVRLAKGIKGRFTPLSCGGSCSPPSIEWKQGGVVYSIQANVAAPGKTARGLLIAAANSAIRSKPL